MSAAHEPADLLEELRSGRREALDRITIRVYDELREIAHRHRMVRKDNATLATTALVHEAYLKLVDQSRARWKVDDALNRLEQIDGRPARIVEYRFFGGMTNDEIAESLGVNVRTVERDWVKARMLLRDGLMA